MGEHMVERIHGKGAARMSPSLNRNKKDTTVIEMKNEGLTNWVHEESKVWVGCIGCYNEGNLVGKWMTADQLEDTLDKGQNLLRAVCTKPQCEEWRIHDYDGPIASCYNEEHPDIDELISVMQMLDEDPDYTVAVMVLRDRYGEVTSEKLYDVWNEIIHIGRYQYELTNYFMEQAIDCGLIKSDHPMFSYIDWEHYAQNCMYDYHEYEYNGETYIVPNY